VKRVKPRFPLPFILSPQRGRGEGREEGAFILSLQVRGEGRMRRSEV